MVPRCVHVKSSHWSIILWVHYLVFFFFVFALMFPITNQGEVPAPVIGLIIFGEVIIFLFYILAINLIGTARYKNKMG